MIKLFKILLMMSFLILTNTASIGEEKIDCSKIKADTGVKMFEKYKCEKKYGKSTSETKFTKSDSTIGKSLKNLKDQIKKKLKN